MEDFFKNIDKERRESEKREKELSDSLRYASAVEKYRTPNLSNPGDLGLIKFEAEKTLLSFHDTDTRERYRDLQLKSSFAQASGNNLIAENYKFEADKLITGIPKKKYQSDLF